jgi:hypothetical protein
MLFVLAVLPALLLVLVWQSFQPPSDTAMLRNLKNNQATFDRLIVMINEDRGLERVDVDWTDPDDPSKIGVSAERIAEYRRMMQRIGVMRGFYAFEPRNEISFLAFARGLSISGVSKGYVWSKVRPATDIPVVDSLDALWQGGGRHVWSYRHIEGPWYLHLRVD